MDYPGQALEEELGGQTITVMVGIDETGTLKDCMLEQAAGSHRSMP